MHPRKQRIKRQGQIRALVVKVNDHLPNVGKAGPDLLKLRELFRSQIADARAMNRSFFRADS
jgi:hypothetical protein